LSGDEVVQYMQFRWAKAGANNEPPFDEGAIQTIARASKGIPRVVNALCDNALTLIYATGDPCVTASHALQVAHDLDLSDVDFNAGAFGPPLSDGAMAPLADVNRSQESRGLRVRLRLRR
jgi:hypothetical protein